MNAAELQRAIEQTETRTGQDMTFMRGMLAVSPTALDKFFKFMPLAHHVDAVDPKLAHIARLATTVEEDCAPCWAINTTFARAEGLPETVIEAIRENDATALDAHQQAVVQFARSVCRADHDEQPRTMLLTELGDAAVLDLSLAVATTRLFTALKRGLGHGTSLRQEAHG